MGDEHSQPWERLFVFIRDTGVLDPEVIFPTPRPNTFMGVDSRVSGTGNTLVEVVTSTVFGPPKVLGNEGPDWKTPVFLRSKGATVNVLSLS